MSFTIPFVDFGGTGEVIHLAHANGFPPETYHQLAQHLASNNQVIGMFARPLWQKSDYNSLKSWNVAADDLIRFLDENGHSQIIGIGHSFGAICTIIAANKRPDLFKKLVLIEPVILPKWFYFVSSSLPQFFLKQINPVAKKTLVRTEKWSTREAAFHQFRHKRVFQNMTDQSLWDYVNSVTSLSVDGIFELNFSKEWEAQIYLTVSNPWKELENLAHPFIAIRGKTSDTIRPKVWNKWKLTNKHGSLIEIPQSGHLVPLEKPDVLAKIIQEFIAPN